MPVIADILNQVLIIQSAAWISYVYRVEKDNLDVFLFSCPEESLRQLYTYPCNPLTVDSHIVQEEEG